MYVQGFHSSYITYIIMCLCVGVTCMATSPSTTDAVARAVQSAAGGLAAGRHRDGGEVGAKLLVTVVYM